MCCFFDSKTRKHSFLNATTERNYLETIFKKHKIDVVVKKLEAIGKSDPRIVRPRTIPGVGPRTAEILVACIDDPHRFANGRQVSAYFGLVPRQYQSGETDRKGRITKRGNPLARTILVECVISAGGAGDTHILQPEHPFFLIP